MRTRTIAAVTVTLIVSSLAGQQREPAGLSALLRKDRDLHAVPVGAATPQAAMHRLLAGTTTAQRAAGITTAVPQGTHLLAFTRRGDAVELTLSHEFLRLLQPGAPLEDAIEQIAKTALRAWGCRGVHILVTDVDGRVHRLTSLLEEPRVAYAGTNGNNISSNATGTGALSGKTILISPGHGYYWHSTLGWTTQRPTIDELTEDIHTAEIANRYLIPALENMGARVISCRERGEIPTESVADNDNGGSAYSTSGAWGTLTGGYQNRTFQSAWIANTPSATATWNLPVTSDGCYPVYVFFPVTTNISTDARYTIHHSGGTTTVVLDQSRHDRRWTLLGLFSFTRAQGARIVLDNQSNGANRIVVADAVRVGGGRGTISRGSSTSGKPRWQECSRYWTQFAGAPPSVWDTTSGQDNSDDVTARPRYAEWRGADAFLSLHTNAGGGTGTSSFIYNGTPSPGSAVFQRTVHTQLVSDIRRLYDSSWTDRGQQSANFGEVRVLRSMPGVLVELAFHDNQTSKDHRALHDPRFRRIGGKALARGIMRYFHATAPFPPEPPVGLRITQSANRGLTAAWEPVAGTTYYVIEQSPDGKGFVEVAQTTQTSYTTSPLPHGSVLSFRVRAANGGGQSFPTDVLTAGTSHTKHAELLMVQGFDRLGRYVKGPENTADYLRLHGAAIRAAEEFSLGFDAATNEAVQLQRVSLGNYRAVNWACGEESTADETFSNLEQSLVRNYLNGGGRLLVTGAEIGWDLVAKGSSSDQAFYQGSLGATYLLDDSQSYGFGPAAGNHIFTGLATGSFDNGQSGTYDVDYPDVIGPADANSTLCLVYGNGRGAAIQRVAGSARVVNIGFPLETITDDTLRAEVMVRALRFLLAPRELEALPIVDLGQTRDLDIFDPASSGRGYLLAASLELGAIPLPVGHLLPLYPDTVLEVSLVPNPVFVAFRGTLDASGHGRGRFVVPNLPVARGIAVYVSGITLGTGSAIHSVLPWVRVRIR